MSASLLKGFRLNHRVGGAAVMASQQEDSPFGSGAPNANPQCLPTKTGQLPIRILKPPKPPERPLMPYMRYSRAVWETVKAEHKDCKLWEIGRIIGQLWRELPAGDKQKYVDEWEAEKNEYVELLKTYQNSAAYQQYLVAKEKMAAGGGPPLLTSEVSTGGKGGSAQAAGRQKQQWTESGGRSRANVTVSSTAAAQHASSNDTPRYPPLVPPVDSECPANGCDLLESADVYNVRRLSAQRFMRNQRLLYEIVNESAVPDLRSIVTLPRMNMLKRQVHSLTMHQQKLESDLEQLHNKFQEKKRNIDDAREEFQVKMRKLCQPAADEAAYEKMVAAAAEQLLKDYDRYKACQQQAASDGKADAPTTSRAAADDAAEPQQQDAVVESPGAGSEPQSEATAADDEEAKEESKPAKKEEEEEPEMSDAKPAAAKVKSKKDRPSTGEGEKKKKAKN